MVFYFGKSALNPIIYGWKNSELRKALIRMLKREGEQLRRGSSLLSVFDIHTEHTNGWSNASIRTRRSASAKLRRCLTKIKLNKKSKTSFDLTKASATTVTGVSATGATQQDEVFKIPVDPYPLHDILPRRHSEATAPGNLSEKNDSIENNINESI